jgi:mannosyl-glycoprotein endo-beta-N-acetylglucosaminidase
VNKFKVVLITIFFLAASLIVGKLAYAQDAQTEYVKALLNSDFSVEIEGTKEGFLNKDSEFVLSTNNHIDYYIQWKDQSVKLPTDLIDLRTSETVPDIKTLGNYISSINSSEPVSIYDENNTIVGSIEANIKYPIMEESEDSYKILLGNQTFYVKKSKTINVVTLATQDSSNIATDSTETSNTQTQNSTSTATTQSTEAKTNAVITQPATVTVRQFIPQDKFFKVIQDGVAVFDNSSGTLVKVGELTNGQIYPRISDYGNWHQVKFGNKYGYVWKGSTQPIDSPNIPNLNNGLKNTSTIFKGLETLTVYDNSTGDLLPFAKIEANFQYPIVSDYGMNWFQIDLLGRIGYIYKPATTRPFQTNDRYFTVLKENVKVFDNSRGELVEVANLVKGQTYQRIADYGNWHQIRFGNGYGFVWANDTKPASGNEIRNLNKTNLRNYDTFIPLDNLQVFDNSSGDLVPFVSLNAGIKYPLLGEDGNWYKVDVSGRIGYVYKYSTRKEFKTSDRYFKVIYDNVKIFTNDTGELVEVGTLEKGQVYPRVADYGNWHQIRYGNKFGFVYAPSTTPDSGAALKNISSSNSSISKMIYTNTSTIVFDNTSGNLVPFATIKEGQDYPYVDLYGENWIIVDISGRRGFIYKGNVDIGFSVAAPSLEVYDSYSQLINDTQQNSNKFLKFGDRVEILSTNNYAAQIRTLDGSVTGWVQKDYLDDNLSNNWWYVKEGRNIRESYSSLSNNLGYVSNNTIVKVLDYNIGNDPDATVKGWYKIETPDGIQGWIWGNSVNGANIIRIEKEKMGAKTNEINIFTPLNTLSTITANQINQFIIYATNNNSASYLYNMGDAFIEAQKQTGVNAVYLLAHAAHETGFGTSSIVKSKYNYYGIGAFDACPSTCASIFEGKTAGIIDGAKWISTFYINRPSYQQFTLDSMRNNSNTHQYATDEAWHEKIASIAKRILDFISTMY